MRSMTTTSRFLSAMPKTRLAMASSKLQRNADRLAAISADLSPQVLAALQIKLGVSKHSAPTADLREKIPLTPSGFPLSELLRLRNVVQDALGGSIEEVPASSAQQRIAVEVDKHESAFYLVDLMALVEQHLQWISLLPRVRPFYAVKCNPDPVLLRALHAMGTGFDCASEGELDAVLNLGVSQQDIIFANPCKNKTHIDFAKEVGVRKMTFDNESELVKIVERFPNAELVLRIKPAIDASVMSFSSKFGAGLGEARRLVRLAKEKGANLVGVSFHVGSGCLDAQAYVETLKHVRTLFDLAESIGRPMKLVDIGGGFPGSDSAELTGGLLFRDVAAAIRPTLDDLFAEDVEVISEPGRYYATRTAVLACNVISRRENYPDADVVKDNEDTTPQSNPSSYLYYTTDGVYGSFNAILFDHMHPVAEVVQNSPQETVVFPSTVFGPTCDSMDVVVKGAPLPKLEVGDWLMFQNMGAYTIANAGQFNGFRIPTVKYQLTTPP